MGGFLPPSGRLTAGLNNPPFYEVWGVPVTEDTTRFIFYNFMANFSLINAVLTANWELFWDAIRHLILPTIAVGTIPLAIIARITRSTLLNVLSLDYVRTARAKGLAEIGVVFRHGLNNALLPVITIVGLQLGFLLAGAVLTETIFRAILPNAITPLIVAGTLGIGIAIVEVASLSFLGLGAQPPTPEWGYMISSERNQIFSAPFLVFIPGIAIALVVLGFNLLGDGLQDALNPRLNRR